MPCCTKEPANSRRAAQRLGVSVQAVQCMCGIECQNARKALPRPPELFEKAFVDLHHRHSVRAPA